MEAINSVIYRGSDWTSKVALNVLYIIPYQINRFINTVFKC